MNSLQILWRVNILRLSNVWKFKFSDRQISTFYGSAQKNYKIAKESDIVEVSFKFGYDCLIKLAIIVAATQNLRVKSRQGHHTELIAKLADTLDDGDIVLIGNEWRTKRNNELYFGGFTITDKEMKSYLSWLGGVMSEVEKFLNKSGKLF